MFYIVTFSQWLVKRDIVFYAIKLKGRMGVLEKEIKVSNNFIPKMCNCNPK